MWKIGFKKGKPVILQNVQTRKKCTTACSH